MNAKLKISLPEPCHQDWYKMTPAAKGKFCSSCEKIVVDFTTYSDQELINYFVHRNQKACGRFNHTQLDRNISEANIPEKRPLLSAAFAGLLAFFSTQVNAQTIKGKVYPTEQVEIGKSAGYKIMYSGTIHANGNYLSGVIIQIEGTNTITKSDANGYFVLDIYTNEENKNITFSFTKAGYMPLKISTDQIARELDVEMQEISSVIPVFEVVGRDERRFETYIREPRTFTGVPLMHHEPIAVNRPWWKFWKRRSR
jgi:hypothetical protein